MRRLVAALMIVAFWFGSPAPSSGADTSDVSEANLSSHVEFLADDAMAGRRTGERGDRIAENYVKAHFEQYGLKPAPGLDGYLQEFEVLECDLDREATWVAIEDGSKQTTFKVDHDVFYSLRGSRDVTVEAEVVFAGFGITAPEYGYDDYSSIDAGGKIVLVLNHEPAEKRDTKKFNGRAPSRYMNPRLKAEIAKAHGAVGVIVVNDELNGHDDLDKTLIARYGSMMKKPFIGLKGAEEPVPLFYATKAFLKELLAGTGLDLVEKQRRIDSKLQPSSQAVPGKKVIMHVELASVESRRVANVIGYLEGDDPDLAGEIIAIGAHHDHLGSDGGGKIYNGADDDASGTAGLLETARIAASKGCGRSLLFISFCGEEQGILGSTYFTSHYPLDRIKAMINMDMIGRNNMDKKDNERMFIVFASAQTPALAGLVREVAGDLSVDVRVAPYLHFRGASDHVVFHDSGIPILFYFSGYHYDYHEPTDTVDKIIPGKMRIVVEHLERMLQKMGRMSPRELVFDRSIKKEPPRDRFEKPY